eukprot:gb/GECH01015016.1/.p1 GENE.gb/GECH01015016.1/~~gb/GECH01015016.1/.p1  ORF type:complete len:230 (+),score=54.28 gb/GECH01015016.1/:1-690(+)
MDCITLTFGDHATTHIGMEEFGHNLNGFTPQDLEEIKEKHGGKIIDLGDEARILIMKEFFDDQILHQEHRKLSPDKQALMYGRVVNKRARYNLCFSNFSQEADPQIGQGTVIDFNDVPVTNQLKEKIETITGASPLACEANYYYDINKCGIGFHGDTERNIVIGARTGKCSFPLVFQWYFKGKKHKESISLNIPPGSIYIMSQKATGNDWKKRNIYTLRHAAGCKKYCQ